MAAPILATKLYIPPPRPSLVRRPRLTERLNEGLYRKLTLITAPAGFGKTTLVSEWVATCARPIAWFSLDEEDNDPGRFLTYLLGALQTIEPTIGAGLVGALQSPQPPPFEVLLTTLLNEITTMPDKFVLVLDDYHLLDAKPVDDALTFLIEHMPPQMHLVIGTREDPPLPVARLRVRGQLTELRATDLRFTLDEAAGFLNQVMGLNLSEEDVAALEKRTEGWIAGLQLAAISMQGHQDATSFIKSFTGSHHFVLDYLVEEVLQQQSESVQTFLLHTSILGRLCGPLCEAVLRSDPPVSGQATLEYLERANLFLVLLDNERRWYRYHHLFAELLRQRLQHSNTLSTGDSDSRIKELHIRASQWFEENGLELEAFHHAAAANDVARAERLMEEGQMLLHLRGAVTVILDWLETLPLTVLNARPSLWWRFGAMLLVNGQTTGVKEKLQAAEDALQGVELDDKTRDLTGRIAAARATLALTQYQIDTIIYQSRRALEYVHPDNLHFRFVATWNLAYAFYFQGDWVAASQAFTEALSISQASGDNFSLILATSGLGQLQELENKLYLATETYRQVLQLLGDQPQPSAGDAYLGLARIFYEWNDLEAAEQYGQQSLQLTRQYEKVIDRFVICELFLARLKLAQGDMNGATALLAQTEQSVRQGNFVHRLPEVAAAQVYNLLQQGNLVAAAHLAQTHDLPLCQARVQLAQGNPAAALTVLEPLRQQVDAKAWQDERLKVRVFQAVVLHAHGEKDQALEVLSEALALAEPGGFLRVFVNEGAPMAELLAEAATRGIMPNYIARLLAVFEGEQPKTKPKTPMPEVHPLVEPLSPRELEVLRLIAQGLSNREIGERLFLALITVKVHNQKIFGKLEVQRRTEAVARARELGLL